MVDGETVALYRPVGSGELRLIADSGWAEFPPRLEHQPIFYPVTNFAYAEQIARDWNTRTGDRLGYVTRFAVRKSYLGRFETRIVGGAMHEEYWIPAEELAEFNRNIVGLIEVAASYTEADRVAAADKDRD